MIMGAKEVTADGWPDPPAPDAFYGLAGDIVRTIEPHTEADPVAILVQFIVAAGNAIGRGPHVRIEGDQHGPNLNAVIIGRTAKGRKGTAWSRVRQVMEHAESDWLRLRVHSGLSTGEGLIWHVRDPIMEHVRDGKAVDAELVEREADPGVADKRLMVLEPEFARVLRVMRREGNTLSSIIREAWDRGDLATLTKHSAARATGAHISIVGHITADELREALSRTDIANGYANRFLYPCAQRARLLPFGGADLDETVLCELGRRVRTAMGIGRGVGRVEMTAEARNGWEAVYPALSAERPGLVGAVIARAEAQVIRLALNYTLLDRKDAIDIPHLRAALALWEYCEASANYVFGNARGDPLADNLVLALREAGANGLSRTRIRDLFGRHRRTDEIEAVLDRLERAGRVQRVFAANTGGRPAEIWILTKPGD